MSLPVAALESARVDGWVGIERAVGVVGGKGVKCKRTKESRQMCVLNSSQRNPNTFVGFALYPHTHNVSKALKSRPGVSSGKLLFSRQRNEVNTNYLSGSVKKEVVHTKPDSAAILGIFHVSHLFACPEIVEVKNLSVIPKFTLVKKVHIT